MARHRNTDDGDIIEAERSPGNLATFIRTDDPFAGIDNDADIDDAFNSMQSAFQKAQVPGIIRVYKVPVDDMGNALPKAQGQIHLNSYAIDQYTYDELISVIKARYMKPGESMTIRVCASRPTQKGFVINRMITLQRESEEKVEASALGQLGEVLRLMQESNQKNSEMMERILTPRADNPVLPLPKRDAVETSIALLGALTPLLTPVLAAMINRPKPSSDLGTMIDAVVKLRALAGGSENLGDTDNDSTASIIKAVAPSALQALAAIAQNRPQALAQPVIRAVPPPALAAPVSATAPPPLVNPAVEQNPAPPASTASPTTEGNPMLKIIREQLSELIGLAEQNIDPKQAAQLAAKLIPQEYDNQLLSLIETPEAFKSVTVLDARCEKHAVWLEGWRQALLAEFDPADGAA